MISMVGIELKLQYYVKIRSLIFHKIGKLRTTNSSAKCVLITWRFFTKFKEAILFPFTDITFCNY